jgi:Tfp pilus assembly protein PilF
LFHRNRRLSFALTLAILMGACRHGANLEKPSTQTSFGVEMARQNLWREAMFRFRRAVELNPDDAMARNNLAVAYEAIGDFDNAARQYREALRLDRGNSYIQKNYSRFTEFLSRNRKRQQKNEPKSAASASPAAAPARESTAPPPEPAAVPEPSSLPPPPAQPGTPPPATPPAPPVDGGLQR